ncbi:MAG: DUF1223 domain-containing protein [Alphaproteobacteria bacterium]
MRTLGIVLALTVALSAAAAERAPVVVELYTSQGCNSCPPADAYLGELAARRDVIALSFHVDYWDYIGWKDPFAFPETTARQRTYAKTLGQSYVYTPEMVVDGSAHDSGTRRGSIESLIRRAQAQQKLALEIKADASGRLVAVLPERAGAERAVLWLVLFDAKHTTSIKRGENAGQTLSYHNVVREMRKLAATAGPAETIALPIDDSVMREHTGCALILQRGEGGPVLGAAVHTFGSKGRAS